jgi:ribosomal protein S12 methylthiotransferase
LDDTVWIRFLYGHPQSLQPEVLAAIARHDNLCAYFDIPIQHASSNILKRMGRSYNADDLTRLFEDIRGNVPEAVLRTTVLVGFPGETPDDFEQLVGLIEQIEFDHLGAFAYSDGDDLASHHLSDHVPSDVADRRVDDIMSIQREISSRNLTRYIGRRMDVLVESGPENGIWSGRSPFQAPEVDGLSLIRSKGSSGLQPGIILPVRVMETMDYDLIVEPVK